MKCLNEVEEYLAINVLDLIVSKQWNLDKCVVMVDDGHSDQSEERSDQEKEKVLVARIESMIPLMRPKHQFKPLGLSKRMFKLIQPFIEEPPMLELKVVACI